MKKVIVILVHYHQFELTEACVNSILQSADVEVEVIIIDNSEPNDRQLDALAGMPEISVNHNAMNTGFGAANNKGIQIALQNHSFDYLFLLNNDTLILENTLFELIKPFDLDQQIGISTCTITYDSDRKKIWYGGGTINYRKGWGEMTDILSYGSEKGSRTSKEVEFVSGCAMLFSRKSISELKGFDPDFFMYVEDLELSIRAKKLGYKLWYTAETCIYHKVQGSSAQTSDYAGLHPKNPNVGNQLYHKKLNQWITFKKHLSGKQFRRFRRNFILHFVLKSAQLFMLSPYRKDVQKAFFNVIRAIRRYGK